MKTVEANAMQKYLPILLILTLAIFSCNENVKQERKLSREEAKQILEAMGHRNVGGGAVVHGLSKSGGAGGENIALVLAVGLVEIETMFAYDEQLGWFTWDFEMARKPGKSTLYIFTKNGKQTITN